jgi:hypothetical protein
MELPSRYALHIKIRLSGHGACHHQYHIVWSPKYRKRIVKGDLKKFTEKRLLDIPEYHPDVEKVAFLGLLRIPMELHVLDHLASRRRHGIPLDGKRFLPSLLTHTGICLHRLETPK